MAEMLANLPVARWEEKQAHVDSPLQIALRVAEIALGLIHPVTASFHDPTPPSRPSSLVDLPRKLPLGVDGNNTTRCPDRSMAGLYTTRRLKVQKAKQWLREPDHIAASPF